MALGAGFTDLALAGALLVGVAGIAAICVLAWWLAAASDEGRGAAAEGVPARSEDERSGGAMHGIVRGVPAGLALWALLGWFLLG